VVVIKVFGELSSGKTSDVDFAAVRKGLADAGAIYVHLSRNQLRTKEFEAATIKGETNAQIEEGVFSEMSGAVKGTNERLTKSCTEVRQGAPGTASRSQNATRARRRETMTRA